MDFLGLLSSVDRERIYGVGFSMGGGWMTTFASRHVDPSGAMFAALVNHTGSVALRHSYNVSPGGRALFDYIFGGAPADVPFRYQRCSTVNIEPSTLELMPDTSISTMSSAAGGGPGVEIAGMAADMRHGVERRRAADDASARPGMGAAGGVRLRHGRELPVDGAALQQRPSQGIADRRIGRRAARLDQRDAQVRIFRQPRRQHATGRASANNDEVKRLHCAL